MLQKIKLVKLLANPATIWLLDELSSNLDIDNKKLLKDIIKIRVKEQGIVIIATHDEYFFDIGHRLDIMNFKN